MDFTPTRALLLVTAIELAALTAIYALCLAPVSRAPADAHVAGPARLP